MKFTHKSNRLYIACTQRILGILIFSFVFSGFAQLKEGSELYKEIMRNDSLLFQVGFNQCKIEQMIPLIDKDLKFYHDKSGITPSRMDFSEGLKKGLCATDRKNRIRRELMPGTTELYSLYDGETLYGVIQQGSHFFYESSDGENFNKTGIAKFNHLWILQEKEWKMVNVLSFDHRPATDHSNKIALTKEKLATFKGVYIAPNTGKIEIDICEGGLLLKTTKNQHCIYPSTENEFFDEEAPLIFRFTMNEDGQVQSMAVLENNQEVEKAIKQSIK